MVDRENGRADGGTGRVKLPREMGRWGVGRGGGEMGRGSEGR